MVGLSGAGTVSLGQIHDEALPGEAVLRKLSGSASTLRLGLSSLESAHTG